MATTVSKYPTDINDSNLLGIADAADPAADGAARSWTGAPTALGLAVQLRLTPGTSVGRFDVAFSAAASLAPSGEFAVRTHA
jgi:hypothetical protein